VSRLPAVWAVMPNPGRIGAQNIARLLEPLPLCSSGLIVLRLGVQREGPECHRGVDGQDWRAPLRR
jgi:hypothetical protein